MPDYRLPKLCFKRCMQLQGNSDPKFNWCTQVKSFFQDTDCMHVWNSLDGVKLKTHYTYLLDKYTQKLYCGDTDAFAASAYSSLSCLPYISNVGDNYLRLRIPISIIRLLAQIRLNSRLTLRFTFGGNYYIVNSSELCSLCNLKRPETLYHLFFECPIYEALRVLLPNGLTTVDEIWQLIYTITPQNAKLLFSFVTGVLKLRAFVLNE